MKKIGVRYVEGLREKEKKDVRKKSYKGDVKGFIQGTSSM